MAIDITTSHYSDGTATVAGVNVTGQGTTWSKVRKGDRYGTHLGFGVRIAEVIDDTHLTLAYDVPGLYQTEAPYEIQRTPYDVGYLQAMQDLLSRLGNGNLEAFAALNGLTDKLPIFSGPGTLALISKLDLSSGLKSDGRAADQAGLAAFDGENSGFIVRVSDYLDGRAALVEKLNDGAPGEWSEPSYVTGEEGGSGPYTDITFGPVTTLPAGTPAYAETELVEEGVIRVDLFVPAGADGEDGEDGQDGTGTGDMVGPANSADDEIVVFSGATGKLTKRGGKTIAEIASTGSVPLGTPMPVISNTLPGGYLWLEGGTYDPAVYPEFAAYMVAGGYASGQLPDWRNRVPRGLGTLTGAVGTTQEDALQNIVGDFGPVGGGITGFNGGGGTGALRQGASSASTYRTALEASPAGGLISFDASRTVRTTTETRVKAFIVRWAVKAYGAINDTGSADLVAIEQAIAVGMVRKDQDQNAQAYSGPTKITLLKNILQKWELIEAATFASVAEYRRDNLTDYRSVRISGWVYSATSGANIFIQTWQVGGPSWQTASFQKSASAVVNGIASDGFGTTDPGYLLGSPHNDPGYGGVSFQFQLFNSNSVSVRTRGIGAAEYFNASGQHTGLKNWWQNANTIAADQHIRIVPSAGLLTGDIVIEGKR